MKVLFYAAGENTETWLSAIGRALPEADCQAWHPAMDSGWQADYALLWRPSSEVIVHQRSLRAIINLGAGVDSILSLPELPPRVPLLKLADAGMAPLMADYIRYGLLHFSRGFDHYRRFQEDRQWRPLEIEPRARWPVGIMGVGAIGESVARQLLSDGYRVCSWSRMPKKIAGVTSYHGVGQLHDFLKQTRALINLLPRTPLTEGLLGYRHLCSLQNGSIVLSCGRGEVFDEQALATALETGLLRGALLDVFQMEPLPPDSALWHLANAIVTPHIAAPTPVAEAVDQIAGLIGAIESGTSVPVVDLALGY